MFNTVILIYHVIHKYTCILFIYIMICRYMDWYQCIHFNRLFCNLYCFYIPASVPASQNDRERWPGCVYRHVIKPNSLNTKAHAENGRENWSVIGCLLYSLLVLQTQVPFCVNNVLSDFHRDQHSTFTGRLWFISGSEWFSLSLDTNCIKVTSWKRCLLC